MMNEKSKNIEERDEEHMTKDVDDDEEEDVEHDFTIISLRKYRHYARVWFQRMEWRMNHLSDADRVSE
jgi:hypothetical protein